MSKFEKYNEELELVHNKEYLLGMANNILEKAILKFYNSTNNNYAVVVSKDMVLNTRYSTRDENTIRLSLDICDRPVSCVDLNLSDFNGSLPGLLGNASVVVACLLSRAGF